MPIRRHDQDDLDPNEDPDAPDAEDEEGLMPCPRCFATIHDESVQCPRCGEYLSEEDGPSTKPWWILATATIVLVIVVAQAAFFWP